MKSQGFTLVQLLVGLALTSLLLAGFASVHGRTRQAVSRIESLATVQDTLVQAMAYLGSDLRQAGYLGLAGDAEALAGVAGATDPVVLPVNGDCGVNFAVRLHRAIEGLDGRYTLACTPGGTPVPGADVLVLRRLAGRRSPSESGRLQAGLWLGGGTLFIDDAPAEATEIRDLVTSVYYVSRPNGSDTPALRRKNLVRGPRMYDEEIAPGITDLQIQFGIDLDGATFPANVDAYVHPEDPRIFQPGVRVVAVRVWLLAEIDGPPGTSAPAVAAYAGRATVPPSPGLSRQLLVKTFHLPNSAGSSW